MAKTFSFHFHDRPGANHTVDLDTLKEAKLLALQCLLDVARDEVREVPFQLALSVMDEAGTTLHKLSMKIEADAKALI